MTSASASTLRFPALVFSSCLALAGLASAARAQALVYGNFGATTGLQLNGDAAKTTTGDGSVLRLVDATTNNAGSVFTTSQYGVSTFSTAFQFRLSSRGGITDLIEPGADGFVFVVQRAGASSLGTMGEGLGYQGIGQSVGVEFDTFRNGFDPLGNSNHLGIDKLGSVTSLDTAAISPDFDSVGGGTIWTAWIDYDGTTLSVRVNNSGVRPGTAQLSYSLNIGSIIGGSSAYLGFTAGTGGAYANHDILNWTYSPTYIAGGVTPGAPVPEPGTYAALAGALVLGAAVWRRRRASRAAPVSSAR